MPNSPLAIITGKGRLPEMLAKTAKQNGRKVLLVCFNGFRPDWVTTEELVDVTFEKPGKIFKALKQAGCHEVVFAGHIARPRMNPLKFDLKLISIAAKLLPALKSGDSKTLDAVRAVFEAEDIKIIGAHEVLTDLLAPCGTLTKAKPSADDFTDMERAKTIVTQMGIADVGQGAVVAQGLCLGVETIQGTDAMLRFIALNSDGCRPNAKSGQGVLVKAPKQGQDWRIDLPAIGPETIENAAKAGLSGIAVQDQGVLILGLVETIAMADRFGLFIHGFEAQKVS
ncbi:MAG: UDP-2,3-diacylglucosamine diphosphatase LpxI [Proteobacteria bacterium]|nr:UDP-2,3-diacylglucosamine diphosphatase LpxI [Pseudomonadota bacterium]